MKKSLQNIIALLKDKKRVKPLSFTEGCILHEAEKGLKK